MEKLIMGISFNFAFCPKICVKTLIQHNPRF